MTTEQKSKIQIWYKRISDPLFKAIVTSAIAIVAIKAPEVLASLKTLTFTTIEDKVNTEAHIRNSLSEMELHQLSEHVGNPDYHMPKKDKDSVYVLRTEFIKDKKKQSEIQEKNAVTMWQMKENQKEQNIILNSILNKIKSIENE